MIAAETLFVTDHPLPRECLFREGTDNNRNATRYPFPLERHAGADLEPSVICAPKRVPMARSTQGGLGYPSTVGVHDIDLALGTNHHRSSPISFVRLCDSIELSAWGGMLSGVSLTMGSLASWPAVFPRGIDSRGAVFPRSVFGGTL